MEKKILVILIVPFLLFLNWFDPVVSENKKGEQFYKEKKYKEALSHFEKARRLMSAIDDHLSLVDFVGERIRVLTGHIKEIGAETLNLSDLKPEEKSKLTSGFSMLSKELNKLTSEIDNFKSDELNDKMAQDAEKLIQNLDRVNEKIKSVFTQNGGGIDQFYSDLVYCGTLVDQYEEALRGMIADRTDIPDLEAIKYNVASANYELGDYARAVKEFLNVNPESSGIKKSYLYHDIGNTLFQLKAYKNALAAFKESLKLDPNDNETRKNYEITLNMLKQQEKDKKKKENKDKEDKDKKDKQKKDQNQKQDKKKEQEDKKQPQNKKEQDKQDKNKDQKEKDKQKQKQEEDQQKKDPQKQKQPQKKKEKKENNAQKPEDKHKQMLRFLNQNEKKNLKKQMQKIKLLKYGIKKSKKKGKDW